ncbi:hypothetical protein BDY19DRAFT_903139 [Irpex rosettiformis]|uniref:Uncharacterized protein n=1 Tax=Irpex rosettiformis TaxID=378272 RepID=A0ACB8UGT9_9APHY|nr:hypothetical protein BDY19DRAFT_903139 [Irpex rosettiformis]
MGGFRFAQGSILDFGLAKGTFGLHVACLLSRSSQPGSGPGEAFFELYCTALYSWCITESNSAVMYSVLLVTSLSPPVSYTDSILAETGAEVESVSNAMAC